MWPVNSWGTGIRRIALIAATMACAACNQTGASNFGALGYGRPFSDATFTRDEALENDPMTPESLYFTLITANLRCLKVNEKCMRVDVYNQWSNERTYLGHREFIFSGVDSSGNFHFSQADYNVKTMRDILRADSCTATLRNGSSVVQLQCPSRNGRTETFSAVLNFINASQTLPFEDQLSRLAEREGVKMTAKGLTIKEKEIRSKMRVASAGDPTRTTDEFLFGEQSKSNRDIKFLIDLTYTPDANEPMYDELTQNVLIDIMLKYKSTAKLESRLLIRFDRDVVFRRVKKERKYTVATIAKEYNLTTSISTSGGLLSNGGSARLVGLDHRMYLNGSASSR